MGFPLKPVSPRLIDACLQHCWPGNVRELENFVKRLLVLDDEQAALAELRDNHGEGPELPNSSPGLQRIRASTDLKSLVRGLKEETEKEAIRLALDQAAGSRKEAARLLKISTKALLQKARQYGIVPDSTLTIGVS